MITQGTLKELFDYVPETGNLIWKKSTGKRTVIGGVAGTVNGCGYQYISINNKLYLGHRIIFLWHHNYLPKYIDHIDRDPLNNRIENLREATGHQNQGNKSKSKNNTSGYKGVRWDKRENKWQSQIRVDKQLIGLGRFSDSIDAAQTYNMAAEQYFGEFAYFNGLPDELAYNLF